MQTVIPDTPSCLLKRLLAHLPAHTVLAMKRPSAWVPAVVDQADLSAPRSESISASMQERQKKRRFRDDGQDYSLLDTVFLQMARSENLEKWAKKHDRVLDKSHAAAWRKMEPIWQGGGSEISMADRGRPSCRICSAPVMKMCVLVGTPQSNFELCLWLLFCFGGLLSYCSFLSCYSLQFVLS